MTNVNYKIIDFNELVLSITRVRKMAKNINIPKEDEPQNYITSYIVQFIVKLNK